MDESIAYLEAEIKKYQTYIEKAIWSTEISIPIFNSKNDIDISMIDLPAKAGTPKKRIDVPQPTKQNDAVDLSEYVNASDFIEQRPDPQTVAKPIVPKTETPKLVAPKTETPEIPVFNGCPVCGSEHRDNIETFYRDTKGNMLETLEFASSDCGLVTLAPNSLLNHLDNHTRAAMQQKIAAQQLMAYNNPDKHIPFDHTYHAEINQAPGPIQQNSKMRNMAPGAYNPDQHHPVDHAV